MSGGTEFNFWFVLGFIPNIIKSKSWQKLVHASDCTRLQMRSWSSSPSERLQWRVSQPLTVVVRVVLSFFHDAKLNNFIACFHPLTLSLWVALSCIMIQLLDWWPKPEYGLLGYFPPFPAFGCWGAVMLYLIDWYVDVQPFAGTPHEFNSIGSIAHPSRMRLTTCCEDRMLRTLQSIIAGLPPRAFSSLNMTEISLVSLPLMPPRTLSRKTQ